MTDVPDWVRDAVFYQVFPDRFASSARVAKPGALEPWDVPPTARGFKGGDLLGVLEHLDYLVDLGVNAIYLNPIFASASNHRYHTYDYMQVDPLLGGNEALRALVDGAHARGIRIVLDGVFNHTGRGFWPFHHVLETGAASPYRSWFHFDQAALDRGLPILAYPASLERAGVALDEPHTGAQPIDRSSAARLGYTAWWDLPALPKLNTDDPGVRDYLFGVAEHWLRFGIDGWRLDVPAEIEDESFWHEFRRRCRAVDPEAYLVGEIWHVAPDWVRGDRFDALMNYPLGEAILSYAGGPRLDMDVVHGHHQYAATIAPTDAVGFGARLVDVLAAYPADVVDVQLNFIGSHDTPRARTVLGGDAAAMRLAVLLLATLPGAPCLYYGDEVGLEGGNDPASRGAFPWDRSRWDEGLHDWTRALLGLRRSEAALRRGTTRVLVTEGRAVVFERRLGDDGLIVAVNAGDQAASPLLALDGTDRHLVRIPLPGDPGTARVGIDPAAGLTLPPRTGGVYRVG
ncbi:MAG: glycoside hydrolase family 13 protein [Chloroflexota bacterium]